MSHHCHCYCHLLCFDHHMGPIVPTKSQWVKRNSSYCRHYILWNPPQNCWGTMKKWLFKVHLTSTHENRISEETIHPWSNRLNPVRTIFAILQELHNNKKLLVKSKPANKKLYIRCSMPMWQYIEESGRPLLSSIKWTHQEIRPWFIWKLN